MRSSRRACGTSPIRLCWRGFAHDVATERKISGDPPEVGTRWRNLRTKPIVWLLRISVATLLLGTVGSVAASFLPVAAVKQYVDSLAPDRTKGLTVERFSEVRGRFRLAAALCLFTAAVLFGYRRQIPRQYEQLLLDRKQSWGTWTQGISSCVQDPWTLWPFLAVFLLGFILRLLELFRPVRYDEAFTYLAFAMHPLYRGLSDYSAPNNHLFHTFLVFLSTHLLGNTLTALRLPALVGGLLLMPTVFAVTAAQYNRSAAIAATALVACAPPLIEYSVNARGYTWQAVFLLLMVWFACRIDRQEGARLDWVGFVLAAAGAVYTIPTSVLPCACIILWLMLIRWQPGGLKGLLWVARQMTPVLLSMLVLVLWLYLPPLIVSGPANILGNRFIQPMGTAKFLAQIPELARMTWIRWNVGLPLAAQVFICGGFVLGLVAHRKIGRQAVPLTPLVILFCAAFATVRTTFGFSRVWLFLWLFFLITAGAGMAFVLSRRWLVAVFAVVFAAVLGAGAHRQEVFFRSTETGNVPDIANAAAWIDQHLDSRDRIVTSVIPGPPLKYLLHQRWPRLEPQMEFGPAPRRIVAVIAKQTDVYEDGHATDPKSWRLLETTPSAAMFPQYDRSEYSEPRVVKDLVGVTIWEAWNVSVSMPDRH